MTEVLRSPGLSTPSAVATSSTFAKCHLPIGWLKTFHWISILLHFGGKFNYYLINTDACGSTVLNPDPYLTVNALSAGWIDVG